MGQPFTAVQPFLELPQPVGSHLREASFIHTEGELHKMFLHRVLEFTAGGVFLIVIPLWVEQLIKFSKPCFVYSDTGYGTLFIISIFVPPLLEHLIGTGVNPVAQHLLQGSSGLDLFFQGQELIIARFQFQSMLDGI